MIKGLLFDLDGTLIDSVPDLTAAIDRLRLALDLPPAGEAQVRLWVGNGALALVERAIADSDDPHLSLEGCHQQFLRYYGEVASLHTRLYPGVLPALQGLRQQGIAMAVVTNKPDRFVPPLLKSLGIADFFSPVVGGDTTSKRKPSPEPILFALKQMGLTCDQALMVGDSVNDIQGGQRANMKVVAVPYGYNHGVPIEDSNPDFLIQRLDELPALLEELA